MEFEEIFQFEITSEMSAGRNLYNEDADILMDGIMHKFRKGKLYINDALVGKIGDIDGKTCEIWDKKNIPIDHPVLVNLHLDHEFMLDGQLHQLINGNVYLKNVFIGPVV